jgi:DNA-binding HxlR family transcriptional regulator
LDVVGDRWTLLVVRELMTGPKRYTDLREGLPGIATDLLTTRLRGLERAGLVHRWELPPPAAAKVYELTERAHREIEPVVDALGRAGLRILGDPDPADDLHPGPLVLMLRYLFRPRLTLRDETYALVVDGLPFGVVVAGGTVDVHQGAPSHPVMQLTLDSTTLLPVLKREIGVEAALDSGAMRLTGDPDALTRFLRVFPWPGRVRETSPVSAVV